MMKLILLNKKYIIKKASQYTSYIFSGIGVIGLLAPISEIFPQEFGMIIKILLAALCVGFVFLVCVGKVIANLKKNNQIEIFEVSNNCHVYVQYGDLFSPNVIKNENKNRNIVIPVNRCFDTIVDNDLISEKTLHGIAFNKMYETGMFDAQSLNKAIQKNLALQKISPEVITRNDKRAGNLKRYPIGSVAEIKLSNECTYFLSGLSKFSYNLKAETSAEDYVLAMQRLIEYCCERSQQSPIVIPLIGAGLSRTNKDERAILEYIVKLLKMNKELIKSDIHIVVRDSGKETIAITDL